MAMPRNGMTFAGKRVPNILTLVNTNSATRVLQLNGLASKDLMVGTPDVSDILSGSAGGGDTFVVGGGSTLINFVNGSDQIIVEVPSSNERDQVILSTAGTRSQEYVYISTALQRTGGRFKVSPVASGTPFWEEVDVLGANSLQSLMPFAATPQQCISGVLALLSAGSGDPGAALIASTRLTNPVDPTLRFSPLSQATLPMVPSPDPSPRPDVGPAMGGAPVLRNFVAESSSGSKLGPPDKIIIPLEGYRNSLLDASMFILGNEAKDITIPIYEVRGITVTDSGFQDGTASSSSGASASASAASASASAASGSTASASTAPASTAFRPGLEPSQTASFRGRSGKIGPGIQRDKAPTDRYAFFYFSQNGLLVLSNNSRPLASAANPGRVIAQLIGPDGQPAKLPLSAASATGADPVFEARFLAFTLTPPPANPAKVRSPARSSR
jgi:hypothetical protein